MSKLTDQQILEDCIRLAIGRGYTPHPHIVNDIKAGNSRVVFYEPEHTHSLAIEQIIFDHEFAKALWNTPKSITMDKNGNVKFELLHFETRDGLSEWQYHLRRMSISEDRVDYLRKWLEENK